MPTEAVVSRDAELLARFATGGDESAFAELVRRHGPLARGVCDRVLGHRAEADDAFQAVLIVLARKAGVVRDPGRLGPWIYGVAVRCAMRARRDTLARQRRQSPMPDMPARAADPDWADVRPVLDAEVDRLPEKLRAAIVLCELQGVARAEAARRLGVAEGTLSSRLARAKETLRTRLTRRGVTLSAAGLSATLGQAQLSSASLPLAGTPSATAFTLAQSETPMLLNSGLVKAALGLLTALGLTLVGIGLMPNGDKPDAAAEEKAKLKGEWRVVSLTQVGKVVNRAERPIEYNPWLFSENTVRKGDTWLPYRLEPGTTPKQINILNGTGIPDVGSRPGIYQIEGDKLTIHIGNEIVPYGKTATGRPTLFQSVKVPEGNYYNNLYVFERVTPKEAAAQKALVGEWKIDSITYDGDALRGQSMFDSDRLVIGRDGLKLATWQKFVPYTADASQSPQRLDVRGYPRSVNKGEPPPRLSSKLETDFSPGIYKIEGDILTWHFAAPGYTGKSSDRPTDFTPSKLGKRHVLAVLKRVKETPPVAPRIEPKPFTTIPRETGAPEAVMLSGNVTLNGKPASAGRVTVYVGGGRFVGALIADGKYATGRVPPGEHRVVAEVQVSGVVETLTRTVPFGEEPMGWDFDAKGK